MPVALLRFGSVPPFAGIDRRLVSHTPDVRHWPASDYPAATADKRRRPMLVRFPNSKIAKRRVDNAAAIRPSRMDLRINASHRNRPGFCQIYTGDPSINGVRRGRIR
jgi:hypothetical protein